MNNLQTGKKNLPVFSFFYFFRHIVCVKKNKPNQEDTNMINARKILRNVRTMTQQERIGLHSGRKPWMLDIAVDDDFGHIPREVMFTCLRMYIE